MSDEIISSESEATVNNQNPSTPPSSLSSLHLCKRDHTHRLHNRIITANSAKRVKVGSQRWESEPECDADIKLNLYCILKYLMDSSSFCWVIDTLIGLWVMTNLVTWLVAKARVDLASPRCLHACAQWTSELPLVLHLVDFWTISRQPFRVIFLSKVEVRRSGEAWWTFHMLSKHYGWMAD